MNYSLMGYNIVIVDGGAEVAEGNYASVFVPGDFNQTNIDQAVQRYKDYLDSIEMDFLMHELSQQEYVH